MEQKKRRIQSKFIFLLITVCLLISTVCSFVLADRQNKVHGEYYALYQETEELFNKEDYRNAQKGYELLVAVYPESYILELKLAICALHQEDIEVALSRATRALKLNPLLAADGEFISVLSYCYDYLEDTENLKIIQNYDAGQVR